MHATVRAILASIVSAVAGWLSIIIGNALYPVFTGHPVSNASGDFTIFNWTVSLILSGVVFVIFYLKLAEWLGE